MLFIAPLWIILLILPGGVIGLGFWMLIIAAYGLGP